MNYPVNWTGLWKKLTIFMSVAISIPVAFVFVIRFFSTSFSLDETFEYVAIWQLPILFLGVAAFSATFALLISVAFKFAHIKIENGNLLGRNFWFFKNSIPLSEITELFRGRASTK